jgi:hypothetical protein
MSTLTEEMLSIADRIEVARRLGERFIDATVSYARLDARATTTGEPGLRSRANQRRCDADHAYAEFRVRLEDLADAGQDRYALHLHRETVDRASEAQRLAIVATCAAERGK